MMLSGARLRQDALRDLGRTVRGGIADWGARKDAEASRELESRQLEYNLGRQKEADAMAKEKYNLEKPILEASNEELVRQQELDNRPLTLGLLASGNPWIAEHLASNSSTGKPVTHRLAESIGAEYDTETGRFMRGGKALTVRDAFDMRGIIEATLQAETSPVKTAESQLEMLNVVYNGMTPEERNSPEGQKKVQEIQAARLELARIMSDPVAQIQAVDRQIQFVNSLGLGARSKEALKTLQERREKYITRHFDNTKSPEEKQILALKLEEAGLSMKMSKLKLKAALKGDAEKPQHTLEELQKFRKDTLDEWKVLHATEDLQGNVTQREGSPAFEEYFQKRYSATFGGRQAPDEGGGNEPDAPEDDEQSYTDDDKDRFKAIFESNSGDVNAAISAFHQGVDPRIPTSVTGKIPDKPKSKTSVTGKIPSR